MTAPEPPEPRFQLASERARKSRTPIWQVLVVMLALGVVVGIRACYLSKLSDADDVRRGVR